MERQTEPLLVDELRGVFYDIEFPEYQREPDVWSRDQKQRLIDSMLRHFDIAAIYLYRRPDNGLECIDGRQRLNAIMSFLGENEADEVDNGFSLKLQNEITDEVAHPFAELEGCSFSEIREVAEANGGHPAVEAFLGYPLTVVYLSGFDDPDEFNLQFLRLNLGTLINAGEKLHAMVGGMRDIIFESERIGGHPFFESLGIPTRRFAKEQTAAQVLLQAFSYRERGEFTRARHFDLQRFVKQGVEVTDDDPVVVEIGQTLDSLAASFGDMAGALRNRAITVSVVLVAWDQDLYLDVSRSDLTEYRAFISEFLGRLRWQVGNMKLFTVDPRFDYLVDFQRHLTQAAVERYAVAFRHRVLTEQFRHWKAEGRLMGDAEYEAETGEAPPSA